MGPGWIGSVIAHGVLVLALLVSWTGAAPELPPPSAVVPVDIIDTIAEETNVRSAAPEPAPSEQTETTTEGAPQSVAPPDPEAPEPVPAPNAPKAKEQPRRPTTSERDLRALIDRAKKEGQSQTVAGADAVGPTRGRVGAGTAMTATESDAIYAHLARCWRAPADMPDPERLIVKVRVVLNADGSLAGQPEMVAPRSVAGADPEVQVAAESALRAIRVCEPFPVNPQRTQRLTAVLNFDPRLMAGLTR